MVTAELALAVPALVLLLALVLGAMAAGLDRVRCVDAARLAARSLARGDDTGYAVSLATRAGPPGARVTPGVGASRVDVTVSVRRSLPLLGWGVDLTATALADREQVTPAAGPFGGGP